MTRSKNTNRNRRQRQQQGDVQATKPPLPPSMPRSEVLENAAEILDAVRHALEDWTGASQISRLKTAVRNFVEQGRSVTWALHHLKGDMPDDEWDEWWTKATAPLQDPISRFFYDLRNPIVKEGQRVPVHPMGHLQGTLTMDQRPPGAVRWVLTSDLRTIWVMEDGSEVPADVPTMKMDRWWTVAQLPQEFRHVPLTDHMEKHVTALERVMAAAIARFGTTE